MVTMIMSNKNGISLDDIRSLHRRRRIPVEKRVNQNRSARQLNLKSCVPKPRNFRQPPHHAVNIAAQSILTLTKTQTDKGKQESLTL
jgi:hypothetical protein